MTRSQKKGPFVGPDLIRKLKRLTTSADNDRSPIKTWSRRSTIIPGFVGRVFEVHNGNKFIRVLVSENMVGRKLGEFAPTRTFKGHSK